MKTLRHKFLFCAITIAISFLGVTTGFSQSARERAEKLYSELAVKHRDPVKFSIFLRDAVDKLSDSRQYDVVIALMDIKIRVDPKAVSAFHDRAVAHRYKGDKKSAIADFSKVIEFWPDDKFSLAWRGRLLVDVGDSARAILDANKLIELDPKRVHGYLLRVDAYYGNGQHDKALDDYVQVVRIDNEWMGYGTHYLHVDDHLKKGDIAGAIADHDRLIREFPQFERLHTGRGLLHIQQGNKNAAIADFNKFVELETRKPYAYSFRAKAYEKMGDLTASLADYNRALQLRPDDSMYIRDRGTLYVKMGKYREAVADLTRSMASWPGDAELYQLRATSHCGLKAHDLAKQDEAKVIELGGKAGKPCR